MPRAVEKKTALVLKLRYILCPVALLLFILAIFFSSQKDNSPNCFGKTIMVKDEAICARVADDNNERIMGLSGASNLATNEGMLFIYDLPGNHGIWMKDMLINIDIIWLDESKSVLHIEENIKPDSYPKVYAPGSSAKYVIELKEGTINRLKINKGDKLYW